MPITESDRIKITVTPTEVILTNSSAAKGDEGDYSVILENPKGQDTAEVRVNVRGMSQQWMKYLIYYI